jgi:hypothetical protein
VCGHIRGLDVLGGVEALGPCVFVAFGTVADDQDGAARCDGVQERTDHRVVRAVSQGGILDGHEVVIADCGRDGRDVGADPVHSHRSVMCGDRGTIERRLRDINRRHLPAL